MNAAFRDFFGVPKRLIPFEFMDAIFPELLSESRLPTGRKERNL